MQYSYKKQVSSPFIETVKKAKAELTKEGFGILSEIDVKAKLKEKLNIDYDNYLILGACNPPFAYQALQAEKEVGLLFPCNLIIYEDKEKIFVSTILPTAAMAMIQNPVLIEVAEQVERKLKKVIDNI
jgi:uncharacterized protein (DUF302 family)